MRAMETMVEYIDLLELRSWPHLAIRSLGVGQDVHGLDIDVRFLIKISVISILIIYWSTVFFFVFRVSVTSVTCKVRLVYIPPIRRPYLLWPSFVSNFE
ncbi:hypothetical protein QFC19_009423 [Naganishia cerealis]|uniref:Uncharacterized protein n=1 Tax=Naganishia cerealis TaxID=610337 RepID=A0ACC2UV00_9TREE|nr:hypothetical protein QFC19_009423 [Naganishia cerealis]